MTATPIDREQIKSYLPHRDPFLFLDRVEEIIMPEGATTGLLKSSDAVGVEVVATYRVKSEHPIFQGHFPGRPILPGVIQVEIMAQAAAFTLLPCVEHPEEQNIEVALLSVHDAKFRRPIIPDCNLLIRSKAVKVRGGMVSHRSRIYGPSQELLSEAETLAMIKMGAVE